MASRSFLRPSIRPELYVCARCSLRASQSVNRISKRWIGMKYLAKVADAELAWQEQATKIRMGEEKSMLSILEERGLVQTITGDRDTADELMTSKRLGVYLGIDPTAPSLHVGHLLPLMAIFWMYIKGYHTVSLLGGATAKIGDPTDRLTTRDKTHSSVRTANMASMHFQLKKLWLNAEAYGRKHGFKREWGNHRELVNNNAWWNKLPMLEVLQVMGPGLRMGSMLARDTVKNKMRKGDGMSYAEFSYPLMQAWDWWYMYRTKGIQVQIGGGDQYGNITAGIDAVKYAATHHPDPTVRQEAAAVGEPFGFTVPLLTTSSGAKFGKSAGNAIWLDHEQTSTFDLYGYFVRTSDADVEKFLKMFTFLPMDTIKNLMVKHEAEPTKRIPHHELARNVVELIHGEYEAKVCEAEHKAMYAKGGVERAQDPATSAGIVTVNNRPKVNIKLPRSLIYQKSISRIFYATGLAKSASEGHRQIIAGSAYISGPPHETRESMNDGMLDWHRITTWMPEDTQKYIIHDDLLLFRHGKHNVRIVQVVPDEEYVLSGESYPGMEAKWKQSVLRAIFVKDTITKEERKAVHELLKEDAEWLKELPKKELSDDFEAKIDANEVNGSELPISYKLSSKAKASGE